MEPQVSLGCEPCLHPEKILIKDGDCGVTVSFQNQGIFCACHFEVSNHLSQLRCFVVFVIELRKLIVPLECSFQCREKTNTAMGCLDTSRGGKLLHCIAASWQGGQCWSSA
ncbi:unnamed protein product [Camellia sinensis]